MGKERQTTSHVALVRPRQFGPNAETAASNFFQQAPTDSQADIQTQAIAEFDALVNALGAAGAHPIVFEDTVDPVKPDAVFPNNWASFHSDGRVFLFPMEAPARRVERRADISPGAVEAIASSLKRSPNARFTNASTLLEALETISS